MDNQDTALDRIMRLGLAPAERFKSLITAWATEYFATPLCERIQELEAERDEWQQAAKVEASQRRAAIQELEAEHDAAIHTLGNRADRLAIRLDRALGEIKDLKAEREAEMLEVADHAEDLADFIEALADFPG
jgi:chromosome segregation ATPase